MVNSRNKGAAGERELARELARIFRCSARRGQQFSGSPDSPDVVTSLPGIHFECKRVEHFNLYDALDQATRDAGADKVPVVCHRRNLREWVLVCRLDEVAHLVENIYKHIQETNQEE